MEQLPPERVREIPKWTRAYAANRTLPALVLMAVCLIMFYCSTRFFPDAGEAWRAGRQLQFAGAFAAGLVCLAPMLMMAVPVVARSVQRALFRALYGAEGEVAPASPPQPRRAVRYAVFALFAGGVLAQVAFGSHIPDRYGQPVAALYVLPFLIMLSRFTGLAGVLYPLLFGLHALLIVAGVPIWFEGRWAGLNILLPVGLYGILSLLAGHVYNRVALRRLRRFGAA
ncbi:MAG: hypothetical protein ACM336_15880 [Acidobacteriota bacterium]